MEFVSWDDDIPNIWKNKFHVPNHQPAYVTHIFISYASLTSLTWGVQSQLQLLKAKTLQHEIQRWTQQLCGVQNQACTKLLYKAGPTSFVCYWRITPMKTMFIVIYCTYIYIYNIYIYRERESCIHKPHLLEFCSPTSRFSLRGGRDCRTNFRMTPMSTCQPFCLWGLVGSARLQEDNVPCQRLNHMFISWFMFIISHVSP